MRIDFTKLGGLFFHQDSMEYLQDACLNYIYSLGKFVGEKYVVSGCVEAAGVCSDGYIVVDGELIKFIGGAISAQIVITETITQEGFDDGTLKDVFYTKVASFGVAGGFPYSDVKRLPFNSINASESINKIASIVKSIVQFEPEVILQGCEVNNITTGPDTMEVSAGLALFDGKLISTPAYAGSYPAYLKEDGGWTNVVPGSGLYIKFDPHTSQRYKNVLDRATIPAGRIIIEETLSDRFVAGVGRWEMKGYQLVSTLQNRVPVGLWYDGLPVANVSDANHQAATNQGGEKQITLGMNNLPDITHGGNQLHALKKTGTFTATNMDNDGTNIEPNIHDCFALNFNNDPVENRQPYTIVVYAKRVA